MTSAALPLPRPDRPRVRTRVVGLAASLLIGCGGSSPAPATPHNQTVAGPRALAPGCFEIERAVLDHELADWARLAASAKLRWLAGGQVPGLAKGNAWPGVVLSDLQPGSLYERMGLRDGDIIFAFNGHALPLIFETVVTVLSDPAMAKDLGADSTPAAMFAFFDVDSLSLLILRDGKPIPIAQVLAGTPAGACPAPPPLRDKDAEQALWTEADWEAQAKVDAARSQQLEAARAAEAAELQAVIDGITRVNDTTFELSRAITGEPLRKALAHRGARLVPALADGAPVGVKIYAVRPGSVHAALGLANGDTLRVVAGVPVTTPEAAIEQLGRLPDQPSSSISLTRRGKPATLTYTLK